MVSLFTAQKITGATPQPRPDFPAGRFLVYHHRPIVNNNSSKRKTENKNASIIRPRTKAKPDNQRGLTPLVIRFGND
jgi:hypothetical protein